jgi:flagellar biosynthesis/type III secretory pathway chaperone
MPDVIDRLTRILEAERQALRQGDLAALAGLTPGKEALADDVSDGAMLTRPQLERIQTLLERNRQLLAAAQEGVRDVQSRLKEQRQLRQGITTYDKSGQEARIATSRPATERRF